MGFGFVVARFGLFLEAFGISHSSRELGPMDPRSGSERR
jgi:hypothetical protein